ncbi:MAG: alkaline serine protease, partial [Gemmatimonas sp.]
YLSSHWGLEIGAAPPPPPPPINIATREYKVKGKAQVDVSWNGATGSSVDLFRNTVKITTPNDGAFTDVLGRVSGTFVYKACNASTTTCSPNATVTF